jgi:hypothetical protein
MLRRGGRWPPAGSVAISQRAAKAKAAMRKVGAGETKRLERRTDGERSAGPFMLIIGQARLKPTLPPADARGALRDEYVLLSAPARQHGCQTGAQGRRPGRSRNCSRHMPKVFEPPTRSAGAEHAAWDAMQNYRAAGKPQREWRYGLFNQLSI